MHQYLLTVAAFLLCTYTDIRYRRVERGALSGYLLIVLLVRFLDGTLILGTVAKGMLPGLICLLFAAATRQALGYGDALLITVCGISIGAGACMAAVLTAFFWAGVWGLVLLRFGREGRKQEFAFVPFLLLGILLQMAGGG